MRFVAKFVLSLLALFIRAAHPAYCDIFNVSVIRIQRSKSLFTVQ